MSHDLERQLEELFSSIDAQVVAPELDAARAAPRRWPTLAMAAAVLAIGIAGVVAVATLRDAPTQTAAPPASTAPATFDAAADAVCVTLERARNGVEPRFSTADAYALVARSRRDAIDVAVASLTRIAPPADDLALVSAVTADLRAARAVAVDVVDAASSGQAAEAAGRWPAVDESIDRALARLARRGVTSCE
jgi:hypothetical protein